MGKPRVFVVGDLLIDRTTFGENTHIAPDAPVPVFVQYRAELRAGGMWNAAANVKFAGADMRAFGVDGDAKDSSLAEIVAEATFDPCESYLLRVEGRTTQVKHRYLGQYDQQILRVDTPKDAHLEAGAVCELVGAMTTEAEQNGFPGAVLVADYGCGVVTDQLVPLLRQAFPEAILVVDPYPTTPAMFYGGADVLTPNAREAEALCGEVGCDSPEGLLELAKVVVVKQGEKPVVVYRKDDEPFEVVPPKRALIDPCGAGDAFVAYLCAELSAGQDLAEAVFMAVHAGACAVAEKGVRVVPRSEVLASVAAARTPTMAP